MSSGLPPTAGGLRALLRLAGIRKRFGATVALDGVGLELLPGEVLAVVGENGAGKSTLLNILAGLLKADEGRMQIEGAEYAPVDPLDAKRNGIGYIHQELSLFPHLSVAENMLAGSEPTRFGYIDREALASRTKALVAEFGRSEIKPDARVGDLSLASRQVVEICRALAGNARILLMDEPTSSLERGDVERLFSAIRILRARGIGVIYVSHFLEEIRRIADRALVLRDGGSVWSGGLETTTDDEIVAHMVGRSVVASFGKTRERTPGDVVLEVRGLESPPGVMHASLTLHRGEVLGIAGLVGSGRTELVRALFGLNPASFGEVRIKGEPIPLESIAPARSIRLGLGYLGEDRRADGAFAHLSVRDNLTASRRLSRVGWIRSRSEERATLEWMSQLPIRASDPDVSMRRLSGGNQQKVLLARLLHQAADVLILDEPTRGVDVVSKSSIYEHIDRMAASGKAVLMVSSHLPELFGICDRIQVMSRGRLSDSRPVHAWTPDSVLRAAIGGE